MADGVLTAAVSVTSAVGGIGGPPVLSVSQGCLAFYIAVAKPSVSNDIVPISIVRDVYYVLLCMSHLWQVFLLALFFIQPLGTSRLSAAFAPSAHLTFLSSPHPLHRLC